MKGEGGHSLPPSEQPLIQNNLEMYRNLKGVISTSPFQNLSNDFNNAPLKTTRKAPIYVFPAFSESEVL